MTATDPTAPAPRAPRSTVVAELRGATRIYQMGPTKVRALDGIDIQFLEGSYTAIMGASGSGKSTMLNILGCLDRPTDGQYILAGRDVSDLDDDNLSGERNRRLGFVFQAYNLIPHLTVLENVEVPMEYGGVSPGEARVRATRLAERMGLGDRLDHRPTELSGGQQQRVAIARALANDPVVLLADEPTGNLDSKTGLEILSLLDELHAQGRTLIIVTHDPKVAARADRTIHMLDGKVQRIEERAS
ncbi:MAG: ABC transporter ATP-binding protein [Planctomycetota bacterium]|nr:ABC transporter ATP-binding protein [Planctomycetota bacterium]